MDKVKKTAHLTLRLTENQMEQLNKVASLSKMSRSALVINVLFGGKGRPKGKQNLATAEMRTIFTNILENNLGLIQIKLDIIAKENPIKYVELVLKISDYVLPKLNSVQEIQVLEKMTYNVGFDIKT